MPSPEPARLSRRSFLRLAGIGAGTLAMNAVTAGPASALFGKTVPGEALNVARVYPQSWKQAIALEAFDDTHAIFADGSAEFLLWPGDRAKLDLLGIPYRVTTANLVNHQTAGVRATGLPPQPGERTAYRVLTDYTADMQALATKYPEQARMFEYPELTLEGRKVYGIEIAANVKQADGRPVVHIDGTHHSREWPSAELPMMFAYDLLESFGTDPRTTAIMENGRVIITPLVNPDGFHHSRSAPNDNDPAARTAYWRKNKRSLTNLLYPAGGVNPYLNADAHGTDPNRNYPTFWGGEGGNSDVTSETYAGSAPYAEPESRNISTMMKSRQITSYLTNHTSGQLVMRPWGFTSNPSPDNAFQTDLGKQMTSVNKYKNQIGLSLYPTSGTSRDWSYDALRTIVYTFEHCTSQQGFHAAYLSTIPALYPMNRVPFLLLCEAGIDPRNHGVITGKLVDQSGAPAAGEVKLHKSFLTERAPGLGAAVPEQINTVAPVRADGTFEVHCNPSTRPRVIMAGGGPEAWEVTVASGGLEDKRSVVIDRGQKVDLGTITL